MDEQAVSSVDIDLRRNTVQLNISANPDHANLEILDGQPASIDIGTGGRLLGVDMGACYLSVMPPEPNTEAMVRSADADVEITRDRATHTLVSVIVPRRGEGYEITYPSGNQ